MSADGDDPIVRGHWSFAPDFGYQITPKHLGENFASVDCEGLNDGIMWYFMVPEEARRFESIGQLEGGKTRGSFGQTKMNRSPDGELYNMYVGDTEPWEEEDEQWGLLVGTHECFDIGFDETDNGTITVQQVPVARGWEYDGSKFYRDGGLSMDESVVYRVVRVDNVPGERLPTFGDVFDPLGQMGIDGFDHTVNLTEEYDHTELPTVENLVGSDGDVDPDQFGGEGGGEDDVIEFSEPAFPGMDAPDNTPSTSTTTTPDPSPDPDPEPEPEPEPEPGPEPDSDGTIPTPDRVQTGQYDVAAVARPDRAWGERVEAVLSPDDERRNPDLELTDEVIEKIEDYVPNPVVPQYRDGDVIAVFGLSEGVRTPTVLASVDFNPGVDLLRERTTDSDGNLTVTSSDGWVGIHPDDLHRAGVGDLQSGWTTAPILDASSRSTFHVGWPEDRLYHYRETRDPPYRVYGYDPDEAAPFELGDGTYDSYYAWFHRSPPGDEIIGLLPDSESGPTPADPVLKSEYENEYDFDVFLRSGAAVEDLIGSQILVRSGGFLYETEAESELVSGAGFRVPEYTLPDSEYYIPSSSKHSESTFELIAVRKDEEDIEEPVEEEDDTPSPADTVDFDPTTIDEPSSERIDMDLGDIGVWVYEEDTSRVAGETKPSYKWRYERGQMDGGTLLVTLTPTGEDPDVYNLNIGNPDMLERAELGRGRDVESLLSNAVDYLQQHSEGNVPESELFSYAEETDDTDTQSGRGDDLTEVTGVGEAVERELNDAGIYTREELLSAINSGDEVADEIPAMHRESALDDLRESSSGSASDPTPDPSPSPSPDPDPSPSRTPPSSGSGDDDRFPAEINIDTELTSGILKSVLSGGTVEEVNVMPQNASDIDIEGFESDLESELDQVDLTSPGPSTPSTPAASSSDSGLVGDYTVGDSVLLTKENCPACAAFKEDPQVQDHLERGIMVEVYPSDPDYDDILSQTNRTTLPIILRYEGDGEFVEPGA